MLLSMTGHGEARFHESGSEVAVELRTINSRFVKVVIRCSDGYNSLEPQIEALLRKTVRRGTIQATVQVRRQHQADEYQINTVALDAYRRQLDQLREQWGLPGSVAPEALLNLPGVADNDIQAVHDVAAEWPAISRAVETAIDNLNRMREEEGRAMAADLTANCQAAAASLAEIKRRAPEVIDSYRKRLLDRVQKAIAEFQVTLNPADVIREVSLFAERSDVAEEIVRLESHFEQFESIMGLPESSGRKLEFLIQELYREANTIGSKSSDLEIARHVIDIKTAIERLREQIQNVE